ncbi:hypothetical protein M8494_22580 [Serratia ureilytica]
MDIGVLENGITEEMYLEMERMIADAKPVSRHLTGLALNLEAAGAIDVASGQYDGELTTVYPDYTQSRPANAGGHYQFLQRTGITLDSTQQHFVLNDEHVLADSRHRRRLSLSWGLPGRHHHRTGSADPWLCPCVSGDRRTKIFGTGHRLF